MVATTLASIALLWTIAWGLVFTALYNHGISAVFGLPALGWLHGVLAYLALRLIVTPPTLQLTLKGD